MHSRATGHNEFVDQVICCIGHWLTSIWAFCVHLTWCLQTADNPGVETELEMQQASESMKEALKGDNPAETRSMDASREELSQLVSVCLYIRLEHQIMSAKQELKFVELHEQQLPGKGLQLGCLHPQSRPMPAPLLC